VAESVLTEAGPAELAGAGVEARLARRAVAAATIGNALEFYDFVTYTFFSIQIGHAFFPGKSAYVSLMLSLATFGAGFITRPIGGIIIGRYADRVGRRSAMMLSFIMMGVAIVALALIPPYAQIGVAAPILAVAARMVQGFSLGGEVGPTTAYLLEAAPAHRRGLAVSWQGASQGLSAAVGGAVGFGLSNLMAPAALDAYGWRIAFLLGAVTLPFGLWLRRTLPETLHAPEPAPANRTTPQPARASASSERTGMGLIQDSRRIIVLALVVLAAGTISTYVFNYMTTFAQHTLHMAPGPAFAAGALGNVVGVAGGLFGGWLSDKVGRRPVMIIPAILNLALLIPIFAWITESRTVLALAVGTAVISLMGAIGGGAFYTAVAESLPKRIRGATFATVYAFSIAIFGGTTQLVITWLIHATHSNMAPAWYLLGASAFGLVARWLIVESAPAKMAAAG
jgi:MFS transporter, MHS family, citrate/tricarballylate:H+ symporter